MEQPPSDDEARRQRANLIALAAVIAIIVIGVWALAKYKESSSLLDCIAAGHRNCAPVQVPP